MRFLLSNSTPIIGAIMKRETEYILEWVAWHRLQGFDIFIADNCSDGPQTALLRQLANAGHITYIDHRKYSIKPQMSAYRRIFTRAILNGYRYIGFLDADEFFEPLDGTFNGAQLVANLLTKPDINACGFRWAIFGSGGQTTKTDGLVVERFKYRCHNAYEPTRYLKSFASIAPLLRSLFRKFSFSFTNIMRDPHKFEIHSRKYLVDGSYLETDSRMRISGKFIRTSGYHLAKIRHYAVKSHAEYVRKQAKPDAYFRSKPAAHLDKTYWDKYNKNDVYDPLDPTLLAALKAKIVEIEHSFLRTHH